MGRRLDGTARRCRTGCPYRPERSLCCRLPHCPVWRATSPPGGWCRVHTGSCVYPWRTRQRRKRASVPDCVSPACGCLPYRRRRRCSDRRSTGCRSAGRADHRRTVPRYVAGEGGQPVRVRGEWPRAGRLDRTRCSGHRPRVFPAARPH